MNEAQGNHWLNSITRVCPCSAASVTLTWVVLQTVISLQNACRTTHGISSVSSPVCQLAGGHQEMALVARVPCTLAEMEITTCKMCKDQVRNKSSMVTFRNGSMPLDTPTPSPGSPNFLCRNWRTTIRRQNCHSFNSLHMLESFTHTESFFEPHVGKCEKLRVDKSPRSTTHKLVAFLLPLKLSTHLKKGFREISLRCVISQVYFQFYF